MNKKIVGTMILVSILFSILVPASISQSEENDWWDKKYDFREEVFIPIDTSEEQAVNQPIDQKINFNNSCWTKSKTEYSIRVVFQEDGYFKELDSQIYDLDPIDDTHIKSCRVVFLIPDIATGDEKYYVYYDDEEKPSPNYTDHVSLGESEYSYELATGVYFESKFFKITEEGYIVYAVAKEGEVSIFNEPSTLQVTKLKPGTTEVKPKNAELLLSFDFIYWWKDFQGNGKAWPSRYTSEINVKNKKYEDGNLMVKFGIEASDEENSLKSTVFFKYYYNPGEDKKLHAHVKHEVTKHPLPTGFDIDASLARFTFGTVKSSTIDDLNFGIIPDYLHFFNEENRVIPFEVPYADSINHWEVYIDNEDDYDLSNLAWLSLDNGETGKAHGIIFNSSQVLKSGDDEQNGIELHFIGGKGVPLPGFDIRVYNLYLMRNKNEPEIGKDLEIPKNYVVEYDAEFFTAENGGYKTIEKEASIYQKLINYQSTENGNITDGDEEGERYSLKVYGFLPQSIKTKIKLLRLLLQRPYVNVELYNQESSFSGRLGRIPITEDFKIDWRNITLFQKYIFKSLKPGTYILKIWLENTLLDDKRELIGVDIIEFKKDTTITIFCKPEGKISINVLDQNQKGIENAEVYLIKKDMVIAQNITNSNGNAIFGAPCGLFEKYKLRVVYKGFLIKEEEIKLGTSTKIIPVKKEYNFDVHDFKVEIKDSKGTGASTDIKINLISDKMQSPKKLEPDKISDGIYSFDNLYPANYNLTIDYNKFKMQKNINIPDSDNILINLYDLNALIKDTWNLTPELTLDVSLKSLDFKENAVATLYSKNKGVYSYKNLLPGKYELKINYKKFQIIENVNIPEDSNLELIFPAEFYINTTLYDTHGDPLTNAQLKLIRNDREVSKTSDENGNVSLFLPPGKYRAEIYYDKTLVAERNIDFSNEKTYSIVTKNEPIYPWIVIILMTITSIILGIICFKKAKKMFFLKILAIIIVFMALVSPWWTLKGSTDELNVKQTTEFYLMPVKMVNLITSDNATSGEIITIKEDLKKEYDFFGTKIELDFKSAMSLLTIIMFISFIGIALNILFEKINRKRFAFLFLTLAFIAYICIFIGFNFGMSEFINEAVGSFSGNGELNVYIPGEMGSVTVQSNWGPSIAYYLYLASVLIIGFVFFYKLINTIHFRIKKKSTK